MPRGGRGRAGQRGRAADEPAFTHVSGPSTWQSERLKQNVKPALSKTKIMDVSEFMI